MRRREFIRLGGGAVALAAIGCGRQTGGIDSPLLRPTRWYFFLSPSTNLVAQPQVIVTHQEADALLTQALQAESAGTAICIGSVQDSGGAAIAGAAVKAFTDAGVESGVARYRDATGAVSPALTSTTSNGGFVLFNATSGRLDVRATSGANGNVYVTAEGGGALLVDIVVAAPGPLLLVPMSGSTVDGANPPVAEPSVTIDAFGLGAPFPLTSSLAGAYGPISVPSSQEIYFKLSKAGFLDSYTLFKTGTTTVVSPAGDLQIFTAAQRDAATFKPAAIAVDATKGIVNGLVRTSAGALLSGATVEARNAAGTLTGTVVYSNAAGDADGSLPATSSSGEFTIFNVDPESVLVVATAAGVARAILVESFANAITIVPDLLRLAAAASPTISVGGTTLTLGGTLEGSVGVHIFGLGTTTSSSTGAYAFASVPSNGRLQVRTTK